MNGGGNVHEKTGDFSIQAILSSHLPRSLNFGGKKNEQDKQFLCFVPQTNAIHEQLPEGLQI
jgi:hypothetical protein